LRPCGRKGLEKLALERAGLQWDAYFSASKLAWLLQNIPAVQAAARGGYLRLGTTDAFFLDHLTGKFATDIITASRAPLLNVEPGAWDAGLCAAFGVPTAYLPEILDTNGDFGTMNGVPLRASVVDQQAALFGHLCRAPGDAKITFGTGAFALAVTGEKITRAPEQGLLPTIARRLSGQTTYAVDGGVYNASSAVQWAQQIGQFKSVQELQHFDAPPAISCGLAFVPALSGLASPHWDRSARALASVTSIDGGLAQSSYFAQCLADILQREVARPAFGELTALGCALLAGAELPPARDDQRFFSRDIGAPQLRARFAEAVRRASDWQVG